jgi:hypothetical protein
MHGADRELLKQQGLRCQVDPDSKGTTSRLTITSSELHVAICKESWSVEFGD